MGSMFFTNRPRRAVAVPNPRAVAVPSPRAVAVAEPRVVSRCLARSSKGIPKAAAIDMYTEVLDEAEADRCIT